jgi:hypothetical protein
LNFSNLLALRQAVAGIPQKVRSFILSGVTLPLLRRK